MYDAYQQRIAECDQALEQHLKGVADKVADTAPDARAVPNDPRESAALGPQAAPESGQPCPAV